MIVPIAILSCLSQVYSFYSFSSTKLIRKVSTQNSPRPVFYKICSTAKTAIATSIDSPQYPLKSNVHNELKILFNKRQFREVITHLLDNVAGGYAVSKVDIDLTTSAAWELRSSSLSLQLLKLAAATNVEVSRFAVYSAMKSFCYDNKYEDILFVLEKLFPLNSPRNPFLLSDRYKWKCRVLCEQNKPGDALNILKDAIAADSSKPIIYIGALRTIMQTCSKYKRAQEVLTAYDMYVSLPKINNQGNVLNDGGESGVLLGNDMLSVFRSARAMEKHELAVGVLSQWHSTSTLINNSSSTQTDMAPTIYQYSQGLTSAMQSNDFKNGHEFLAILMSHQYENISSIAASVLYNNLVQNGLTGFKETHTFIRNIGLPLGQEHFTYLLASKSVSVASQAALLEAMILEGLTPENKALSIFLQTCYKERKISAAIKVVDNLKKIQYKLNEYHYSILVEQVT